MEYLKSFWNTEPKLYHWISVLILFNQDNKITLDKGYVFLGNMPIHSIGNYINFTNFNIIDGALYYMHNNGTTKSVDPTKVYLHFKFGSTPFQFSSENKDYWNLFFSSLDNKIYNSIVSDLTSKRIRMMKLKDGISHKKSLSPANVSHPLFSSKQVYGLQMDQVILSGINPTML